VGCSNLKKVLLEVVEADRMLHQVYLEEVINKLDLCSETQLQLLDHQITNLMLEAGFLHKHNLVPSLNQLHHKVCLVDLPSQLVEVVVFSENHHQI
jgi:hypothetical protein